MATLTFDTYDFIETLEKSGFSQKQAKAVADGLKHVNLDHISTKEDIMLLKEDMHKLEMHLTVKVESIRADIFKWIVPIMLGQAGLTAALVKLLH